MNGGGTGFAAPSFDTLMAQYRHDTIETLQSRRRDLERENARLEDENGIFESFVAMNSIADRTVAREAPDRASKFIDRARGRAQEVELQHLQSEHKTAVAMAVQYALTQNRQAERARNEAAVAEKRAMIEEYERRLLDIHKYDLLFTRDVVEGGVNPIPGRGHTIMAEKVQRFFRDVLSAQDNLVKKLLLKNAAIKTQIKKLQQQVRQKEEMNEVLGHIDFGQLKIENRQHLTKIEEKNAELLHLKSTAGNAVLVLNKHKSDLTALLAESHKLHADAEAKRLAAAKVQHEAARIKIELEELEAVNTRLRKQQKEYIVPSVLTYVQATEAEHNLHGRVRDWQRKVEIAEMALKRQKRALLQLESSAAVHL